MLNFSSVSEGKAFLLAVKIFESKKTEFETINQAFSAILNITTINSRNILEGMSLLDRNKVFDLIISCVNQGKIDVLSDESIKKIRTSALMYIYQKHELSDIKNEITSRFNGFLHTIINNIDIDFYESLPPVATEAIKKVLIDDLAFFLADKIKNSKFDIGWKVNIDVLNLSSEKDLNEMIFIKAAELIIQKFSKQISFKISNIYEQIFDVSDIIFRNLAEFIQNEVRGNLSSTNLQKIRERERSLHIREQEIEEKEKKVQEIMTKNLEFSKNLQNKSSEIDAKLDQIEVQKFALQDYMDRIVEICKKVIDSSSKLN